MYRKSDHEKDYLRFPSGLDWKKIFPRYSTWTQTFQCNNKSCLSKKSQHLLDVSKRVNISWRSDVCLRNFTLIMLLMSICFILSTLVFHRSLRCSKDGGSTGRAEGRGAGRAGGNLMTLGLLGFTASMRSGEVTGGHCRTARHFFKEKRFPSQKKTFQKQKSTSCWRGFLVCFLQLPF